MKQCPNCGQLLEPDINYCGECGYQLKTPVVEEVVEEKQEPVESEDNGKKNKHTVFMLWSFILTFIFFGLRFVIPENLTKIRTVTDTLAGIAALTGIASLMVGSVRFPGSDYSKTVNKVNKGLNIIGLIVGAIVIIFVALFIYSCYTNPPKCHID